jgi:CheY-like chemotaxis protein
MGASRMNGDTVGESFRPARPCVLLAEDDRAMREFIAAVLRRDGYDVVEASDGTELVERLAPMLRQPFDPRVRIALIISDVRMPGLTGLQVLETLRWAEWSTPIILITAFGDEATHRQARAHGATAVFDKPFALDELRAAVRAAVPRA